MLRKKVENQEEAKCVFHDNTIKSKAICYDDERLEKLKRVLKKKLKKAGMRVNIEKKKELIGKNVIARLIYKKWWIWEVHLK